MQAFLIHRTHMRREAQTFLTSLQQNGLFIESFFLKKSYGRKWRQQAESNIYSSEIVIIYDAEACATSTNTQWEIDRAKELGKPVVSLSRADIDEKNVGALQSAYDFNTEFDDCFTDKKAKTEQLLELYKIMVESSEKLIQRRQITNGFFITIIGAIIGAAGFAVKEKIITDSTALVLVLPTLIGLLMCRSWGNLIENYGKLNAGKFKVIHKIESQLDAKIFAAEWVALGKGVRKEKYQSFTTTEKNVPRYFSYLLWLVLIFTLFSANWEPITSRATSVLKAGKDTVLLVYEHLSQKRAIEPAAPPTMDQGAQKSAP
jgi:hypothetical protein